MCTGSWSSCWGNVEDVKQRINARKLQLRTASLSNRCGPPRTRRCPAHQHVRPDCEACKSFSRCYWGMSACDVIHYELPMRDDSPALRMTYWTGSECWFIEYDGEDRRYRYSTNGLIAYGPHRKPIYLTNP